tara:strand:+ start:4855 stop:5643 length:789 start_codon:yes stop_codon:yes gene_type:complete
MALTEIKTKSIKDGEVKSADIADSAVTLAKIEDGTTSDAGKFLKNVDGGAPVWDTVDTTTIPVADEDSDGTCFPVFTTAATGDQAPKTNEDKLKFDAGNGTLEATNIGTIASGGSIIAYGAATLGGRTEACSLNSHGINISTTSSGPCDIRFGGTSVSDYIAFKSDGAFSGTTTFILPDGDGSADQVLKTDGSGNLDWTDAGSGATGGGTDKIFWENGQTVTTNYTLGDSFGAAANAMSAGPITINNGVTVTINSGETWTIV